MGRSFGFTLVELLVVVGVIGILVVAVLLTVNPFAQVQKANDVRRKSDLSQVQRALEAYFQDSGKYPLHSNTYKIIRLDASVADWGQSFSPYMAALPKDPRGGRTYIYFASSDRQAYWLYASLERSNDPGLCNKGNPCPSLTSNGIVTSSCGGTCNFSATSSNVSP